MAATRHPLDSVFKPRSVALIGASADARKLNGIPLSILRMTGFPGAIYPVNPRYREIDGVSCFPDVESLPETPDVAVIMIPAEQVPGALEHCGGKGIASAVVFSSGFEEVAEASELVRSVRRIADRYRIALVGPNCEGVWSVRHRALLTFGSAARRETLAHAPIAMVSQSGSMAGSVARHLQDSGFGCAYVVSVGNETVLGLLDFFEYLIAQDDVRVVLLFLEGLKDGARLIPLVDLARQRGITVVALKCGSSAAGRVAVASHTGKMTSEAAVYRDLFAQAGIVSVDSLVELVEAAEVFSTAPLPRRSSDESGVTVFSIPGGTRALTADWCEARGVPLATLESRTTRALEQLLPRFGSATNPTDMTGQVLSQPDLFARTLDVVADDDHTSGLIVQLANRGPADAVRYRDVIAEAAARRNVPTVITFLADALPGADRYAFAQHRLLCARDPADAVRYFDWLFRARRALDRPGRAASPPLAPRPAPFANDWAGAMRFMTDAGIGVPPWAFLRAGERAATACAPLRFPVALKALPEDAEHKTERGLVRLNLATPRDVDAASDALRSILGRPDATLLVQQMAPPGVEAIVTVMNDPDFGPIVAIGSGGVMVELIDDLGYVGLPIEPCDVERVLDRLALDKLLRGYRGAKRADRAAFIAAAINLLRAFEARCDVLQEVEINPLIVLPDGEGVVAVDALITLKTRR